jgi:hypothetical protein
MGKLCLKNYYQLIHKANIHLVNSDLYKDVVKIHMPKLLDYWADLMIFNEISRRSYEKKNKEKRDGE